MIITTLGWGALIVIALVIILIIYSVIDNYIERKRTENYYKTLKEFGSRISDCRYWLNSEERLPYQELFDFIVKEIKEGGLRGDSLRDKVDEIINKKL